MDRDALAVLLEQGLCLAEIGRRFGRDESTIGYWVAKHGLEPVNAAKHAPRGGLTRERLEPMVDRGDSVRAIAKATGYSPTAVRYWLKRHGLATLAAGRRADGPGASGLRGGVAESGRFWWRRPGAPSCCAATTGSFVGALHFHHVDPATKLFTISNQGITRSLDVMRSEAAKCKLVCANCHAELEADLQTLEEGADKVFASGDP